MRVTKSRTVRKLSEPRFLVRAGVFLVSAGVMGLSRGFVALGAYAVMMLALFPPERHWPDRYCPVCCSPLPDNYSDVLASAYGCSVCKGVKG